MAADRKYIFSQCEINQRFGPEIVRGDPFIAIGEARIAIVVTISFIQIYYM